MTCTPWAFQDTASYYKGGAAAWSFGLDVFGVIDEALVMPDQSVAVAHDPALPVVQNRGVAAKPDPAAPERDVPVSPDEAGVDAPDRTGPTVRANAVKPGVTAADADADPTNRNVMPTYTNGIIH